MSLEPRDHIQYEITYASPAYSKVERYLHIVTLEHLPRFLDRVVEVEGKASGIASQLYRTVHARPPEGES